MTTYWRAKWRRAAAGVVWGLAIVGGVLANVATIWLLAGAP